MSDSSGYRGRGPTMAAVGERAPVGVEVERAVTMKTRDGTTLVADVYRPGDGRSHPVLLYRGFGERARLAGASACQAERTSGRGYVVVIQEARGRCDSEGEYLPFAHEAEDGYDAVEWAASLPGSTGMVGMYGQSYSATVQYLTATLRPPHLGAMVPVWGAPTAYMDFCYCGGALELANLMTYTAFHAPDTLRRAGLDPDGLTHLLADKLPEWPLVSLKDEVLANLPLDRLVALFARGAPFLADQLDHASDGEYWWPTDVRRRFHEIDVPILHIGSWYDNHLFDTVAMYSGIRRFGRTEDSRRHQRLVIAPFAHTSAFGGPNHGSAGEIDFGPGALTDVWSLQMAWFDYFLGGVDNGVANSSPARVFVLGANAWRDESSWPPPDAVPTALYLHSQGHANSRDGDGVLGWEGPETESPDTFDYDPMTPVPSLGGRFQGRSSGPVDQRAAEVRPDVLVYTSLPVEQAVEIGGKAFAVLYARSSAVDTDFVVKLVDVHPDGYAQLLTDGIVRARFRDSLVDPELIEPGRAYAYMVDLWSLAHAFLPGHRIRAEITSSSFPRWNRNLNTGGPMRYERDPIIARQVIEHSREFPSRLVLPIRESATPVGEPAVVLNRQRKGDLRRYV
jgi:uncharacterized protein